MKDSLRIPHEKRKAGDSFKHMMVEARKKDRKEIATLNKKGKKWLKK